MSLNSLHWCNIRLQEGAVWKSSNFGNSCQRLSCPSTSHCHQFQHFVIDHPPPSPSPLWLRPLPPPKRRDVILEHFLINALIYLFTSIDHISALAQNLSFKHSYPLYILWTNCNHVINLVQTYTSCNSVISGYSLITLLNFLLARVVALQTVRECPCISIVTN